MKTLKKLLLFALLFSGFLSLSLHQQEKYNKHWKSTFGYDKGGYYSYLPALFIYNFNVENYPSYLNNNTVGYLFQDGTRDLQVRYPYGTALLQMPFFLIAHCYATISNHDANGYTLPYQIAVHSAAVFYFLAGLFLLFSFLRTRFPKAITLVTVTLVALATNLLYYAIDDTGMSHIYSFFLFTALLVCSDRLLKSNSTANFLLLVSVSAVIVFTRYTNVFVLPVVFLLFTSSFAEIKTRLRTITIARALIATGVFLLFSFIQLSYNHYITGNWIVDTYKGESFTNFTNPKLLEVWFAAKQGMFPYSLALLFCLPGMVLLWKKQKMFALYLLLLFIGISYLNASWHIWFFGSSFGARWFAEFTPLYAIPIAYFLAYVFLQNKRWLRITAIAFGLFFMYSTVNLVYSYDKYFGQETWDYREYLSILNEDAPIKLPAQSTTLFLDCDNDAELLNKKTCTQLPNGNKVSMVNAKNVFSIGVKQHKIQLYNRNYNRVFISFLAYTTVNTPKSRTIFAIDRGEENITWRPKELHTFKPTINSWNKIEYWERIPKDLLPNDIISILVQSRENEETLIDELEIRFE